MVHEGILTTVESFHCDCTKGSLKWKKVLQIIRLFFTLRKQIF